MPNLLIVSRKQYHRYDFLKRFSSIQISGSVPDMPTTLPSGKASGLRHYTRARFGWDYRIPGYGLNGVLHVR